MRDEFDRGEHNSKEVDWSMLEHIDQNYFEYKNKKKLIDFNDMIKMLLEKENKIPEFDVVFIDEAQDLSPLQWKLYDILKQKSKDIYLAGDDDQAIFAWAGADVNRFINEPAKEKILKYSKRISKAVQEQSEIPIEKIGNPPVHQIWCDGAIALGYRPEKPPVNSIIKGEDLSVPVFIGIAGFNRHSLFTRGLLEILGRGRIKDRQGRENCDDHPG